MNLTIPAATRDSATHKQTIAIGSAIADPNTDRPDLNSELPEVHDRYAESVLRDTEALYDRLEVHGVRDQLAGTGNSETCFEVDNDNPQLFSVYAHMIEGGMDAVGDFSRYEHAEAYARELAAQYGWPVSDYVPDKHRIQQSMQ